MNKQIDLQQIKDGFKRIEDLNDSSFSPTLFGSTWVSDHPITGLIGLIIILSVIYFTVAKIAKLFKIPKILALMTISGCYVIILILMICYSSYEIKANTQQKLNQEIKSINMSYNELYNNPTKPVSIIKLENKYQEKIIEIYGRDTIQKLLEQNNNEKQTEKNLNEYLNR